MGYPVMRDSTVRSHYESVERVIAAMRGNLDQPMTLRELARIGFASPYHFNRTFRQTQKKVIDICYEVGYSSVGTFTRRFADVLGVSPVRFRKLTDRSSRSQHAPVAGPLISSSRPGTSIAGHITAPSNFQGTVAVGLFTSRIPQGKPVSCTVIQARGIYEMENVPEGEFYLFAVGLKKQ